MLYIYRTVRTLRVPVGVRVRMRIHADRERERNRNRDCLEQAARRLRTVRLAAGGRRRQRLVLREPGRGDRRRDAAAAAGRRRRRVLLLAAQAEVPLMRRATRMSVGVCVGVPMSMRLTAGRTLVSVHIRMLRQHFRARVRVAAERIRW